MVDGQLLPELATLVEDKPVVVFFDADLASNVRVWQAAERLRDALELEGASPVLFARCPAGGSTGLDDLLGARPPEKGAVPGPSGGQGQAPAEGPPARSAGSPRRRRRPALDVTQDRLDVICETTDAMLARWDGRRLFNHGEVISELRETGPSRSTMASCGWSWRRLRSSTAPPATAWPLPGRMAMSSLRSPPRRTGSPGWTG